MKLYSSRGLAFLLAGCVAGAAVPAANGDAPLARRLSYAGSYEDGAPGKVYVRTSSNSPNSRLREVRAEDVSSNPRILQPVPARAVKLAEPAPLPVRATDSMVAARTIRRQPQSATGPADSGMPPASSPMSSQMPPTMIEPIRPDGAMGTFASDCPDGCCDPCCDSCFDRGWIGEGLFSRGRGRWFAGVEGIMARPHFSEPTAFLVREGPVAGPGNVVNSSDTFVYYTFDYEANARGYIGYRLDPCCAEIRATYLRLDSEASETDFTNANATRTPTFFEVQPGPNQPLFANTSVSGDIFDVEFARCINTCEEHYTNACDPCDTVTCPAWDLQWSAGARLARWDFNTDVFTSVATDGRIDIDQEFIGAGPKIGLEARRYWGRRRQFSVYSTFDAAILIGQYEHHLERNIPPVGVNPATTERFSSVVTRAAPVTEIELGVKWQATRRASLSAGWFFQAWWDLGMSTQQTSNLLGGLGPQFLLDDSNIMSWDGLTLRAEYAF